MYPFLSFAELERWLPMIRKYKVSLRARQPHQFLSVYSKHGSQLPIKWEQKRNNFISRHLVQYRHNPTIRRRLALITWAFDPEYHD